MRSGAPWPDGSAAVPILDGMPLPVVLLHGELGGLDEVALLVLSVLIGLALARILRPSER